MQKKLLELPDKPGCYIMRDRYGRIIYVGKAVSLRKRVRSYFRAHTLRRADPKLLSLVKSVDDLDIIVLRSEAEAVLMEGRLIKDYRPRYNVSFRDDKRFPLLRIDLNQPFPRFTLCRIQRNDSAVYFGPCASSATARAAQEFVEKKYGIRKCAVVSPGPDTHAHCLNDIIRFCAAPCIGKTSKEEYRAMINQACAFLRGERPAVLKELGEAMQAEARTLNFEKAMALRDTLQFLRRMIRSRTTLRRTPRMKREDALAGVQALGALLGLKRVPRVIEAFDVSNISGTHAVAGMVAAVDGLPRPARYRYFRIKTVRAADDTAMLAEAIRRRYLRLQQEGRPMPDLVLVDGGLGQLHVTQRELEKLGLNDLPVAALAKRPDKIYCEAPRGRPRGIFAESCDLSAEATRAKVEAKNDVIPPCGKSQSFLAKKGERAPGHAPLNLPGNSQALQVLQRLRDEAHRFALAYHRRLREKKIRESVLDEIPGVSMLRKQKLLLHFGSVSRLARATVEEIAAVPGIGSKLAEDIKQFLPRVSCARNRQS